MERSSIAPLQKISMTRMEVQNNEPEAGCCGGAPTSNADACCKLDEEKKADGESGCGCGSTGPAVKKSSCC